MDWVLVEVSKAMCPSEKVATLIPRYTAVGVIMKKLLFVWGSFLGVSIGGN